MRHALSARRLEGPGTVLTPLGVYARTPPVRSTSRGRPATLGLQGLTNRRMVARTGARGIGQDHAHGDPRMGHADERTPDGTVMRRAASGRLR
jgi:hypothetical protein